MKYYLIAAMFFLGVMVLAVMLADVHREILIMKPEFFLKNIPQADARVKASDELQAKVAEVRNALRAINRSYGWKIEYPFIKVENPKFQPGNGENIYLILELANSAPQTQSAARPEPLDEERIDLIPALKYMRAHTESGEDHCTLTVAIAALEAAQPEPAEGGGEQSPLPSKESETMTSMKPEHVKNILADFNHVFEVTPEQYAKTGDGPARQWMENYSGSIRAMLRWFLQSAEPQADCEDNDIRTVSAILEMYQNYTGTQGVEAFKRILSTLPAPAPADATDKDLAAMSGPATGIGPNSTGGFSKNRTTHPAKTGEKVCAEDARHPECTLCGLQTSTIESMTKPCPRKECPIWTDAARGVMG